MILGFLKASRLAVIAINGPGSVIQFGSVRGRQFSANATAIYDAPPRCDQRRINQFCSGFRFIHSAASLMTLTDVDVSSPVKAL
jgi:hypothetical protein